MSISTTHELFKLFDIDTVNLLKQWDYILILDEVLDVISISNLGKKDLLALEELKVIRKNKENNLWEAGELEQLEKYSTENKYSEIVRNLIRNSIEIFEDKALIWLFPIDVISAFKDIYILTFMFDGYPLRPYLELYEFLIKKYTLNNYELVDYYEEDVSYLKPLINIIDGKMNDIGKGHSPFSLYWFDHTIANNTDLILTLRNNLNNFYKNKCLATEDKKFESIMWTIFKDHADKVTTRGFEDNNLIAHNIRATNKYIHKANLAYLVNRNYNPVIKRWLISKGLDTNDDSFALSEAIQWIFRSRIRENKPINLYIPSERMRMLLINWIGKFSC